MIDSEAGNAALTVTLLGPMRVQVDGRPLPPLRSRKALWLLALLILRAGRPVERKWLAETLWPDSDQRKAAANIRVVLSELRRALGSQGHRLRASGHHIVMLDLAGADVDVNTFDVAVTSLDPAALGHAVALYRGPLLEGCNEEWVPQERAMREQSCLQMLQTLGDTALAKAEWGVAADLYRRAVGIDPWRETAQRGLMEALTRCGNANAAMEVYRTFLSLLREDDPRAAPDEKTRALYNRLRAEARLAASRVAEAAPRPPSAEVTGYLPHPLTDLVGREDEREEVVELLRQSRLVTLTGPGGIGKTRLAIAVAEEAVSGFADGAWLVALESLSDGGRVPIQVAGVLGLKENTGKTLLESLTDHLRNKRMLLVLDNCEHLLDASAQLAVHLLGECPGLRLLTTSREALGIAGETAWTVTSLSTPDLAHLPTGTASLVQVLAGYESVQLFVVRARAVQKGFELNRSNAATVAQVCARLEGIPLALELAAAQVRSMPLSQMAARLDDYLGLLKGQGRGAPPRQKTLRAALDWSYDLLRAPERVLLGRLSVFAGGWDLEAAEQVCGSDGMTAGEVPDFLTGLVDKSLVVFSPGKEEVAGRYRLLEPVRQYAAERLAEAGNSGTLQARHRIHFQALAEEAKPHLAGAMQKQWLQRLEMEHDNLRVALSHERTEPHDAGANLRLASALWRFWSVRGHLSTGREFLRRALERADAQEPTLERADALNCEGMLAHIQGDDAAARALHEEALNIVKALGDGQATAGVLNNLATVAIRSGDYSEARQLLEEGLAIFQEIGDKSKEAISKEAILLGSLSSAARMEGDHAAARSFLEKSLRLHRETGDVRSVGRTLANLGNMARLRGDYTSAQAALEESLSLGEELQDQTGIGWTLSVLGGVAHAQGDYPTAQALFEQSLTVRTAMGDKSGAAWARCHLGCVALSQGDLARARSLLEESLAAFRQLEDRHSAAWALCHLGRVATSGGDIASGQSQLAESLTIFRAIQDAEGLAGSLGAMAGLTLPISAEKATRLFGAAQALRQRVGLSLPPNEQKEYNRQTDRARAALGEAEFAEAWQAGHALARDRAVAEALEGILS